MVHIFALPNSVYSDILCVWLELRHLASFDTSLCNIKRRRKLFAFYRQPYFKISSDTIFTKSSLLWVADHSFKLNGKLILCSRCDFPDKTFLNVNNVSSLFVHKIVKNNRKIHI